MGAVSLDDHCANVRRFDTKSYESKKQTDTLPPRNHNHNQTAIKTHIPFRHFQKNVFFYAMDRSNDWNRVPVTGDMLSNGFGHRTGSYESTIHKRDGSVNRNGLDSSRSARDGNSIDPRTKRVDRIRVRNSRTVHPNHQSKRIFRMITTHHPYKMKHIRKRLRSNSNRVAFDSKHINLSDMETHARRLYEDGSSADKQLFDEPNGSDDMSSRSKPKSDEACHL